MHYIVSGANGMLGQRVVKRLIDSGYPVLGLYRTRKGYEESEVKAPVYVLNSDFISDPHKYMIEDTVFLHLAFGRAVRGAEEIADSVDFSFRILKAIRNVPTLKRLIYVSSQSVYGKTSQIRTLDMRPAPEISYSMAKYAVEKMVEIGFADTGVEYCILRLESVAQSQNLIPKLCFFAITNKAISIYGGQQVFSFIDCEDAVDALVKCITWEKHYQRRIYNVGPDCMRVTLKEVADLVAVIAQEHGQPISVNFQPDNTASWAGMDTSYFCEEFCWNPKSDIYDMVARIYEDQLKK